MTYAKDPRVDAYIDGLPGWQQAICHQVRDLVHAADEEVTETIKRTRPGRERCRCPRASPAGRAGRHPIQAVHHSVWKLAGGALLMLAGLIVLLRARRLGRRWRRPSSHGPVAPDRARLNGHGPRPLAG